MILLISYDLNGNERPEAYEAVKKMITTHATSYKKPLYSQWFVETTESPDDWHKRMKEVADSNDHWYICRVEKGAQGWLPKATWEWIRTHR